MPRKAEKKEKKRSKGSEWSWGEERILKRKGHVTRKNIGKRFSLFFFDEVDTKMSRNSFENTKGERSKRAGSVSFEGGEGQEGEREGEGGGAN